MQIWPAIDLRGGKCVRLEQGDYARETVFGDDPAAMARHWVDAGAELLHLVDLDGAKSGRVENWAAIEAILSTVDVPCELGGGVRDEQSIARLLDLGLHRVVIGTLAVKEPEWFRRMCRKFPEALVLGLDARGGLVATEGWLETSRVTAVALARQFAEEPLAAIISTDIDTDGMLAGPNLAALAELTQAVDLPVIASGGVTTLDDITRLAALGVAGCIIGRALYEGTINLPDALAERANQNEYTENSTTRDPGMTQTKVQDIRNIVFCGHGSAGKTTLVDAILNATGAVKRHASVDDGSSICDFDEEEKHHHHSLESSLVHFQHAGKHFNLVDTPGYPDFIAQVLGVLHAVDTAAIVIDAHAGPGVNTRRVFLEAGKHGLGRIIIVNKMDTENVNYSALLATIQELFGKACVPLNVPLGHGPGFKGAVSTLHPPAKADGALVDPNSIHDSLIESIIEVDDEVTERYFEGTMPTDEELSRLIVESIAAGSLIPVLCVSGKTGVGLSELLDALAACALPPDKVRRVASNEAGEETPVAADPAGPLVAQVFKTRIDPFVHKLSFIRIYSGTIKKDDIVHVSGARKNVKLHQLLSVQASETQPIDQAGAGEIVAVAKVDELHTGQSLGERVMPPIKFPTPMVGLAVTPKSRGDEGKLSGALNKIVEEDGTVQLHRDGQTHELVMNGMSELHLLIIRERLKRRDKVEVDTKEPKIPYRETVQATAEGSYRHKKQSGGRGQFGEVHIRVFPLPSSVDPAEYCIKERFASMREFHYDPTHNFLWVDSIVGGSIPNNFLPAVEKGFKERLDRGVVAGYQIQNVGVEVFFGKHHPVDSSEAAFKTAGSMAFRNVFQQAKPGLLEPIVILHVTVPGSKLGDISSDMSGRRGRVLGMDSAGGDLQTLTAEVPLSEVTTYARALSSITGGQGSYSMEFSRYDLVPGNVQKEIVDKAVLKEEEEE